MKSIKKDSNGCEPEVYLKDGKSRFRFPFPDENHSRDFGNYGDFERGVMFRVPKSLGIEQGHRKISFNTQNLGIQSVPRTTLKIDCIQIEEGQKLVQYDGSNLKEYTIFEIVQQKAVILENGNYQLQTVIRCPYCQSKSRLSYDEILNLFQYVGDDENCHKFDELQKEIVKIAFYGYTEFSFESDNSIFLKQ